jgi:hypothetical protein
MSGDDFLGRIAAFFATAIGDLASYLTDEDSLRSLLARLGQTLEAGADIKAITAALGSLPADLTALSAAAQSLIAATGDPATMASQLQAAITALGAVENDVRRLAAATPGSTLPAPFNSTAFWQAFARDAVDLVVDDALAKALPLLHSLLRFVGGSVPLPPADPTQLPLASRIRWSNLPQALVDPSHALRGAIGWAGTLDTDLITTVLIELAAAVGSHPELIPLDDPVVVAYWGPRPSPPPAPWPAKLSAVRVSLFRALIDAGGGMDILELAAGAVPIPAAGAAAGSPPTGLALFLDGHGSLADTLTLTPAWSVTIDGQASASLRAEIRPAGTTVTTSGDASAQGAIAVTLAGKPDSPWTAGDRSGTRVELSDLTLIAKLSAAAGSGSAEEIALAVSASAAAYLDLSDADNMVSSLLGSSVYSVHFIGGLTWSSRTGLKFTGGASFDGDGGAADTSQPGLHTQLPVHLDLGGILSITGITLQTTPTADSSGGAAFRILLSGGLSFGPFTADLTDIGLGLRMAPPGGSAPGNLGPLDLTLEFVPPRGWGIFLDADVVSGGGYLAVDSSGSQYLGAVAVSVGTISVQGVGVLNTRPPGGGWSLIALADVSGLAIQLGFGIEITGMGVLVGVNRTMNVAGLQALARSGGLSTVMFPADLAANAPRVAADLGNLFPVAHGQYVFGPTVQLSWGAGALINAELAVYLELPSPLRVAVLGALQITLPDPDEAVVDLHLDLLGVIDLTAKTIALDMSLSHSSLAEMPLTGQAALRAGWGGQPAFLLAVGGWSPYFTPPAGFPPLDRIGLSMGDDDLQLRLTSYFAITTNTVQLGAAIDLYATAGPAAITATASFDALIQFKPFKLELDLAIFAAITLNSQPVMTLSITAHLIGPDPWHLSGQVQFSVVFFSFTIPISGTFGSAIPQAAPQVVDIFGPLAAAVADPGSWILPSPPGPPVVLLRNGSSGAAVHPLGSLALHQRVVPLEQQIDRFGADVLPVPTTVSLSGCGATTASDGVPDLFAPAQFVTMTDAEKLSAPSFQALTAGFTIGGTGLVVPVIGGTSAGSPQGPLQATPSALAWDALVIDCTTAPVATGSEAAGGAAGVTIVTSKPAGMTVPDSVLAAQLPGAAAAVCGTAASGAGAFPGLRTGIAPQEPYFAVASLGLANENPPGAWFGSPAAAASAVGPAQQTVYLSELSQLPGVSPG